MDIEQPICMNCKNLFDERWSCAAYPAGIPPEITQSVWDHRKPARGDDGIHYDPISDDFILPSNLGKGEIDTTRY
jgi:hypothetical protein